jgi:copper homeostasis protein CutC
MKTISKLLAGKKTFLAAALMVVLAGLKATGYIDDQTYQILITVAGALGLTFLRMGISK